MAWDFSTDPEWAEQLAWVDDFVRSECEPIDLIVKESHDLNDPVRQALIPPLQKIVKDRGLWATHLGPHLGGPGYGQVKLALLNEILGRSECAPIVFGSQAPDSGNSEILAHYGTPELKKRYLEPLLDNRIVSCFSMTEPQGGADPKVFTTTATQDGDDWIINGEKWFSSFASMASFIIVMAMTDPDAPPYERYSMFVVPAERRPASTCCAMSDSVTSRSVAVAERVMSATRTSAFLRITCSDRAAVRSWSRRRGWAAGESTTPCGLSGWCGASTTCSANVWYRDTRRARCCPTSSWSKRWSPTRGWRSRRSVC
jgi:alkylation response protein AidB-like acyl-CoA dehydrogenase